MQLIEQQGFEAILPEGLFAEENQMAGNDTHRANLLQRLLDDPTLGAIVCARGGYGSVRIVDQLDFTLFAKRPKWIVGYSDVTVFHSHLNRLGFSTLHATMPIDIRTTADDNSAAFATLLSALMGNPDAIACPPHPMNRIGDAEAQVVGGNLSILYSLAGSPSAIDTRGKILLIEDLDEYLYHIDRMMTALRRSGMLAGLKGVIVGGLNNMHDNAIPFGLTAEQIVLRAFHEYDYPIVFGAPIGHLGLNNHALPLGVPTHIEVSKCGATIVPKLL